MRFDLLLGLCVAVILTWSVSGGARAHHIEDTAGAYDRFEQAVSRTANRLPRSRSSARNAIQDLQSVTAQELASGWIARGALQAEGDTEYARSIREAAEAYGGSKMFARLLGSEPSLAMQAERSHKGLRAALDRIRHNGIRHKWLEDAAYAASLGRGAPPRPSVLIPMPASKPGLEGGLDRIIVTGGGPEMPRWSTGTANDPGIAERMMAIGAIKALGHAEDPDLQPAIKHLLQSQPMNNCVQLANLNLSQCLSATHADADLVFCLSAHAIGETSRCFNWILPEDY